MNRPAIDRFRLPASKSYTQVLEGPESMPAAQAVMDLAEQKREWPYPWSFPPPGAIRVTAGADSSGTLVVPVAATPTAGLTYTVDEGFSFALEALIVTYLTGGIVGGWDPGAATWSIVVDRPVGVTSFQGYDTQGLTDVDVPLGSLVFPFRLECPEIYRANDTLRIVFTNSTISTGAGNFFKSILLGWRWPTPKGK